MSEFPFARATSAVPAPKPNVTLELSDATAQFLHDLIWYHFVGAGSIEGHAPAILRALRSAGYVGVGPRNDPEYPSTFGVRA